MFLDIIRLIRLIGPPYAQHNSPVMIDEQNTLKHLLYISEKNKIQLLYLEHARKSSKDFFQLHSIYSFYIREYSNLLSLVRNVAEVLEEYGIEYAIFKTLKPFPAIPSDVDVLLFDDRGLTRAHNALMIHGYNTIKIGANSIVLSVPKTRFKIDLQGEVAVSHFIYSDKHELKSHIEVTDVDGSKVSVLSREADLFVSINHSLYKEQLYTLADFYYLLFGLANTTRTQISTLVKLSRDQGSKLTIATVLALTKTLHLLAFNTPNLDLDRVCAKLAQAFTSRFLVDYEARRFANSRDMPYKYSPATLVAAILFKLQNSKTRCNLPKQLVALLHPSFFKDFTDELVQHFTHKSY